MNGLCLDPENTHYPLTHTMYSCKAVYKVHTYINNQEVKPTPGVGEVFDEAISNPLQKHLQNKDVCEDFIGIFQHCLYRLALLDVNVLKSLNTHTHQQIYLLNVCLIKMTEWVSILCLCVGAHQCSTAE